jgi:hypothetical protein
MVSLLNEGNFKRNAKLHKWFLAETIVIFLGGPGGTSGPGAPGPGELASPLVAKRPTLVVEVLQTLFSLELSKSPLATRGSG